MLDLRPNCECCDRDLPPSAEAYICTFECTWCTDCVDRFPGRACPNCGGDLQRRPTRPVSLLGGEPGRDATRGVGGLPVEVRGDVRNWDRVTMHRVVAGALTGPGGVLVAHRRSDRAYYPDCWDLPGGHVELGESAHDALVRELREEIGVRAFMSGPPIATITSEGDDPMHLDLWVISRWVGAPRNLAPEEHDELRWATADQLAALDLAHPRYCALLTSLIKNDRAV